MKDVYVVLRQKELELSRLEDEVEALRVVAPILSEGEEAEKAHLPMELARKTLDHKRFHLRQLEREKPTFIKKLTTKGEPKLGKEIQITISVGVAYSNPKTKYHHDVIHAADKSLYKAKEKGRNQVVSAEEKD